MFSPVYWLLLVLFPPLIFYYVVRLSRNRNVRCPWAALILWKSGIARIGSGSFWRLLLDIL